MLKTIQLGFIVIALGVSGCVGTSPTYHDNRTSASSSDSGGNKKVKGALLGGLAGGAIGLLKGDTKGAIIGAIAGATVGGLIGAKLDAADEKKRQQAMQALSTMKAGSKVRWSSPEKGTEGTLTSTSDKFAMDGLSCMSFIETVSIAGEDTEIDEVRCLEKGQWLAKN